MAITTLRSGSSVLTLADNGPLTFRLGGRRLWQANALCILHYHDRQHPRAQQVLVPWDDSQAFGTMGTLSLSTRSTLEIRQVDERAADVEMAFDTIHMRVTLRISLDASGDGFDVSVAPDGGREQLPRL
jgi:hypothetical protein